MKKYLTIILSGLILISMCACDRDDERFRRFFIKYNIKIRNKA